MARYIDADALIERLKFKRDTDINRKKYSGLECAISQVQKQQTIDVVEVEQGYWIKADELAGIEFLKCSVCGITHPRMRTEYCCDCGAKMDGERKCDND